MILPKPEQVRIGGHVYKIVLDKDLGLREGYKGTHGSFDRIITLDNSGNNDNMTQTFIHECNEAISRIYCADRLNHDDIDALSEGQFQVWQELDIKIDWGK